MNKRNQKKVINKLQKSNPVLLKGASLEEQNNYIQQILDTSGIKSKIRFEPEIFQKYVDEKKTFGKGLVAYLEHLEKQLDQMIDDKDLKLYIFQILSELGSLVFPSTSACYSIIPNDLKQLKWEPIISKVSQKFEKENHSKISEVRTLLNVFLDEKNPKTVYCLVSLCLCNVLIRALNKDMNALLINENGKLAGKEADQRPRIKAGDWLNQLAYILQTHLMGLLQQTKITPIQIELLNSYSISLAAAITEELLNNKLIVSYKTIKLEASKNTKTPKYFVWFGSSLLVFPKTLSLPMVFRPEDWSINQSKGADNGGYLLSPLTNISYQGYLDSRSYRIHEHRLRLKKIDHINCLQKVTYAINCPMINFYKKYKKELTNNQVVLLSDTWLKPTGETILERNKHWAKQLNSPDKIREAVTKELVAKKNETWRSQEVLKIAELYSNKVIYWPAVQDFRGRIYRIGHLNIQLGEYDRSLTSFYSDKAFVNRKKNKYTMAKFNLLLKTVLVEKDLVEKWDNVFGDRFINNETFEELLLEDLLAKKLSLIQIGQLLLIRQGAYDRVGVYYDASASAYQIMGVINEDYGLCQLTNVLEKDGSKQDIYAFFLRQVKSNIDKYTVYSKDKEIILMYNKYFRDNVDRKLIKAIVMPLVYGKTSQGFAEDLKVFFAKGYLYPSERALVQLAAQIIKTLKEDPIFTKIGVFMKGLRATARLLFDLNKLTIRGAYGDTNIVYYKEEKEQINLYYKKVGRKYKSQKINLSRPIRDAQGTFIKSKTKAVNAFIANYVHFLDASVCHYVIDALAVDSTLNLGTIHDCFFIKPEKVDILKKAYKEGLIKAHRIHVYNMVCWLYDIQGAKGPNKSKLEAIIERLRLLAVGNETLGADSSHTLQQISWNNILKSLEPIRPGSKHPDLIEYLEMEQPEACLKMEKLLNTNCGQLLFPDN